MFYNESDKQWFIDELQDERHKIIFSSVFSRTAKYEQLLQKDVLEFTFEECNDLILHLKPKSKIGISVYKTQFKQYVDWGIANKKVPTGKNHWDILPVESSYIKFMYQKSYIKDRETLNEIIGECVVKKYEKLAIYLMYEGLTGHEMEELCYARDEDLDVRNRTLKIRKRDNQVIPVSKEIVEVFKSNEEVYSRKPRDEDSPMLIKPFVSHKNPSPDRVLSRDRIFRIVKALNEEYFKHYEIRSNFSPISIWKSGMYYMLFETEQKNGELTDEDFVYASGRYGRNLEFLGAMATFKGEYAVYKEMFW